MSARRPPNRQPATVSGLNVPTDPLPAFNQICDQDFTNNSAGNTSAVQAVHGEDPALGRKPTT
jgi:hypothetical protein